MKRSRSHCLHHLSEDIIARIVEKVFEKMLPLMKEYLDAEVGKINKEIIFIKEENNELRNRIEYLEIKEKSCDLIFEGIKELSCAEAAFPLYNCTSKIIIENFSDHFPIFLQIPINYNKLNINSK